MRVRHFLHAALLLAGTTLFVACGANRTARVRQPVTAAPTDDNNSPLEADYVVTARFVGNSGLAERQLLRTIEDYLIELARFPTRAATLIDAEFDLEDLYRHSGYPQIRIHYEVDVDATARTVDVRFDLHLGPLVTTELVIGGVESFDQEEDILPLWIRQSSGTLGLGAPLYVEADLRAFVGSIRHFYALRGYRDVQVDGPDIEIGEDAVARVSIAITENAPSILAGVSFADSIRAALGTARCDELAQAEGEIAAAVRLAEVRRAVVSELLRSGYPNPNVRPLPSVDPSDPLAIQLRIDGDPGKRGRVEEVVVRGNEATTRRFVESHLNFELGDWFDGNAMDRSRRDLYLSGIFSTVEFSYEWIDGESLRLVIDLVEEDSRTVDILIGYGSYERLRSMVRFEERNLFGTGRRLAIEGRASSRGERGIITVTDPRLFGTHTEFTVGGDIFEREEPSFTDRAGGLNVALSRSLGRGFKVRTGYTFRKHSGSSVDLNPNLDDYTQGNLFAELRFDRRDSVLYPRKGFLASLQFDADNPAFGSDIEFQRLRFSISGYMPVFRGSYLAVRASMGALWPGETSNRIPLQERFFNGGEGTVRSFRESRLGPLDVDGAPLGGEYHNTFTTELRVPLRGLFEGALFVDVGNVGSDVSGYGLSNLRVGIGAGLRFNLPIGPIRVDGAFNPDRIPGEDEWVVHLSVGYPF